jgi:hypothetical protein
MTRPDFCTEEMLEFLDDLRESGATNMFGAAPYLADEFPDLANDCASFHSSPKAREVLGYWMHSFDERRTQQATAQTI